MYLSWISVVQLVNTRENKKIMKIEMIYKLCYSSLGLGLSPPRPSPGPFNGPGLRCCKALAQESPAQAQAFEPGPSPNITIHNTVDDYHVSSLAINVLLLLQLCTLERPRIHGFQAVWFAGQIRSWRPCIFVSEPG